MTRRKTIWERPHPVGLLGAVRTTTGAARRVVTEALHPTVTARHVEWTMIASAVDSSPAPTPELVDLALRAAAAANRLDLTELIAEAPDPGDGEFLATWPGEHYRLLAGLMLEIQPTVAVEVGTFRGLGTAAMAMAGTRVVTYDIIPASEFDSPWLPLPRVEQRIGDLADASYFADQRETLLAAQLLFLDGPKDGHFEAAFLERLLQHRGTGQLLVFDDIRLPKMVGLWRDLPLVKLDLTSFGHYTGTGLAIL